MINKQVTSQELISFLNKLDNHDDYLFLTEDGWCITNEWLCGTFAGRCFIGKTKEDAAQKLINYFNQHIKHDSIVGNCVTNSGWPNLTKVKHYLTLRQKQNMEEFLKGNQ